MSNLSIGLTFSDDGEYLQLSRMDAAILLTWIMGGDHDNGEPVAKEKPAEAPQDAPPAARQGNGLTSKPLPSRDPKPLQEQPLEKRPVVTTPEPPKAKAPVAQVPEPEPVAPKKATPPRAVRPPIGRKEAAAQIVKETSTPKAEKILPDLPFPVTSQAVEFPSKTPPPEANELLEEEPYWEYGDAVAPEPKL